MPVVVDSRPLEVESLGLKTVGQVLAHVQRDNRLVVHVLLDGQEPDLDRISTIKQNMVERHTLFIETVDPRQMCVDLLDELSEQVQQADSDKLAAADFFREGHAGKALEKLSGCFRVWQQARESVAKVAEVLRLDLKQVRVDSQPVWEALVQFANELRAMKQSLENRDFVNLADILTYEMEFAGARWQKILDSLRAAIRSLR